MTAMALHEPMPRLQAVTAPTVLRAEGLIKRYGATTALAGAELAVRAGEVHGLVGANGAGKSTLVKSLSGAVRPDAGTLGIADWDGPSVTPRHAQELGLATIYQDPSLVPTLGPAENIVLGRERTRGGLLPRDRQRPDVQAVLDRVGLQLDPSTPAGALKPADQQLLEIAKALYRNARVIIMDEPTAALGPAEGRRLLGVIDALRRDGVAIVYISHRLDEVLATCDRITVMRDGRHVRTDDAADLTEDALVRAMIGHEVLRLTADGAVRGKVALEAISISQGKRLTGVSLRLHEGEVVGLTGLVGSGRSRLARILFGAEPSDGGEMLLGGQRYAPRSPADAIAAGVGLIPEDRKRDALLMHLSNAKNVTLSRLPAGRLGVLNARRERSIAARWLDRLQVEPRSTSAAPITLSGGNQQKIAIARWLHADARILIFDEPGQGVDVGAKEHILRAIRELAAEGRAVLVISEELDELVQVADRVLVMRRGRIAGELGRDEVTEHRVLELAMGSLNESEPEGAAP